MGVDGRRLWAVSEHEESGEEQVDPVFEDTRKAVNRGGLATLGLAVFALSIPMFIGVARGVSSGDVWDPETGVRVVDAQADLDVCQRSAAGLMRDASEGGSEWDARREKWVGECASKRPALERMIDEAAKGE